MKTTAVIKSEPAAPPLSPAERKTLAQHEETIVRNLHSFLEVGHALASIRDAGLYHQTHKTFAEYVREKFDMGVRRAEQIAQSAAVVKRISDAKLISHLPEYECQVRPLVSLAPEKQAPAWAYAVKNAGGKKITKRGIEFAVRSFNGWKPAPRKPRRVRPRYYWDEKIRLPDGGTDEDQRNFIRFLKIWRSSNFVRSGLVDYIRQVAEQKEGAKK